MRGVDPVGINMQARGDGGSDIVLAPSSALTLLHHATPSTHACIIITPRPSMRLFPAAFLAPLRPLSLPTPSSSSGSL